MEEYKENNGVLQSTSYNEEMPESIDEADLQSMREFSQERDRKLKESMEGLEDPTIQENTLESVLEDIRNERSKVIVWCNQPNLDTVAMGINVTDKLRPFMNHQNIIVKVTRLQRATAYGSTHKGEFFGGTKLSPTITNGIIPTESGSTINNFRFTITPEVLRLARKSKGKIYLNLYAVVREGKVVITT